MEDWVEVTVQVPRHLVRRFYGLFGELVDETAGASTPVANGATPGVATPGLKPWSEDDDALALKVLHKNDVNAFKFLRIVAERAGEKVPYAEIDSARAGPGISAPGCRVHSAGRSPGAARRCRGPRTSTRRR